MNKGQGFVEWALILVLVAVFVIMIYAALTGNLPDPRWECDMENRTGWEREYQYDHLAYTTVYNPATKHYETRSHAVYVWKRVRQMQEKEYAIHCLKQGE